MKYKEASKEFREEYSRYISSRTNQIIQAIDYWADYIIKYLLFANAGGSAVILFFIGISDSFRRMSSMKFALLSFIFGLIIVGILMAILFYRMSRFYKNLRNDAHRFLSNKIDWEELLSNDEHRLEPSSWGCVLGWVSLFFFMLGIIIALIGLLP